jgi:hypothetical protein
MTTLFGGSADYELLDQQPTLKRSSRLGAKTILEEIEMFGKRAKLGYKFIP